MLTLYLSRLCPAPPATSANCAEGAGLEPEPVANRSQRFSVVHLALRFHPPPGERTTECWHLRGDQAFWRKVGSLCCPSKDPTRREAGRSLVKRGNHPARD